MSTVEDVSLDQRYLGAVSVSNPMVLLGQITENINI